MLELIAGDRPGLLCDIGKVLMEERVDLLAAKIMTVGERAEDVFYLASLSGSPLDEAAATRLQQQPVRRARSPRRRVNRPPRTTRRLSLRATGAAEEPASRRPRRCRTSPCPSASPSTRRRHS